MKRFLKDLFLNDKKFFWLMVINALHYSFMASYYVSQHDSAVHQYYNSMSLNDLLITGSTINENNAAIVSGFALETVVYLIGSSITHISIAFLAYLIRWYLKQNNPKINN